MQGSYPLDIGVVSPPRVARWRPLVNWLLVIPHQLWLFALSLGAVVLAILGWFAVLFTGRIPDSWTDYIIGVLRYQWRVTSYLLVWTDRYPDFEPPAGYIDPGDYPAVLYCARPLQRNRLTVLLRLFLALPHIVLLYLFGLAGCVVLVIAWFAVLLTGRWPQNLRRFCFGLIRWNARTQAYLQLVTDEYPPFGVEA